VFKVANRRKTLVSLTLANTFPTGGMGDEEKLASAPAFIKAAYEV
jgi:hypothetical protein